jgi:PAS domain S-box-containing protein
VLGADGQFLRSPLATFGRGLNVFSMALDDSSSTAYPGTPVRPTPAAPVERAASTERLYQLLVSNVADYAIFALDSTGHVITWNTGAKRIKGYDPEDIIGQHFSKFYPQEDIDSGKPTWELEVAAREGRLEDEGWRLRKDGSRFWANVIITALRDETGTLVGFAKVTRDLTERRAAEERAIEDARRVAEAEAADRAKTEFLATMSHELRTPLNAIGGYAELLAVGIGGKLSEEQRLYVDRIERSQQHLLAIINDLLDFGRIEAGGVAYDIQPVPLTTIVDAVELMVEPQAVKRNLTLERQACAAAAIALADGARIQQILLNLLSNAVKFTPAGGRIMVSCEGLDGRVTITVRDTGIGIPADKLEAIFDPFVQVGRSLTTSHEGAGLGLSISRNLARAMGGDLTVESTVGQGSTFRLILPRATD